MSLPAPRDAKARDNDPVTVRVACDQDAAAIARVYNHYVDAGHATFDTVRWTTDHVVSLINGPAPEQWFVAAQENVIVGWASVRPHSLRHGYRFTCETAIYVDSAAIGRGVGNTLQTRQEEHCRRCGIHHAIAKVIADNDRSLAFHYRCGYELVGIQKEIGHMNGRWTDVAILQKIFN
jgi:L-amino acid N-acyltransferase YncA